MTPELGILFYYTLLFYYTAFGVLAHFVNESDRTKIQVRVGPFTI